jgi:type I restriction enzyme S subunit
MTASWPRVSLGELVRLERRPVEVAADCEYREIGIYSYGRGIFHKTPRSGLEVGDKDLFLMKEGDLIFQVTFAWEGAIALCSKAEDGLFGSVRFPTYRVNEERCFAPFLARYLCTHDGLNQVARICPGSAGRNRVLAVKRLPEIEVPLPPIEEQRRIVQRIEELTGKIREAQKLHQSATAEVGVLPGLLVAKTFRDQREGAWSDKFLGDYVLDCVYGTSEKTNDDASGTPILRMGNIQGGQLRPTPLKYLNILGKERKKLLLLRGDILVNRTNSAELVGKCAVFELDGEFGFASYIIRLRLDVTRADPRLVAAYINSPTGRAFMFDKRKQMTGQANVNATTLKKLPLSLPPLDQQRKILNELDSLQGTVNSVQSLHDATAAELNALTPSVLNRAFNGELV